MKVISGTLKSRIILTPNNYIVRPTSNKARESIYNILFHRFNINEDIKKINIIDVFAGTGSLSIEGLSRGANSATLIEKDSSIFSLLKKNINTLFLNKKTTLINIDLFLYNNNFFRPYDICFIDAPYLSGLNIKALKKIYSSKWIDLNTIIICEKSLKDCADYPENFKVIYSKKYGSSIIDFLKLRSSE